MTIAESNTVVALDTCSMIYFFENHRVYGPLMGKFFQKILDAKKYFYVSSIALVEILPKVQKELPDTYIQYRAFFEEDWGHCRVTTLTAPVALLASELVAKYSCTLPDSIHLACAIDSGVTHFLTNDKSLKRITEIEVVCLDDLL